MTMKKIMLNTDEVKRTAYEIVKYAQKRFDVHISVPITCRKCTDCPLVTFPSGQKQKDLTKPKGRNRKAAEKGKDPRPALPGCADAPSPVFVDVPCDEDYTDVSHETPRLPVQATTRAQLLKEAVIQTQEKRCHVVKKTGNDIEYKGLTTTKGTRTYNAKKRPEFIGIANEVLAKSGTKLYITLKADRVEENGSMIRMWTLFHERLGRFLNRLARDYGAKYFCSVESHADGRPHAHVLACLEYAKTGGNKHAIKDDSLYIILRAEQKMKNYWKLGEVKTMRIDENDKSCNLPEYVTKEMQCNIDMIYKHVKYDGLEMTENELKFVNTLYWLSKIGRRQFMYTKSVNKVNKGVKMQTVETQRTQAQVVDTIESDFEIIARANLTGVYDEETDKAFFRILGTFIPEKCKPQWFFMSQKDKEAQCLQQNGEIPQSVHNRMFAFAQKTMRASCDLIELYDKYFKQGVQK